MLYKLDRKKKIVISYLVAAFFIIVIIFYYFIEAHYAGTDNAYVKANKLYISPEINGKIVSIVVKENEQVKKEQVLITIDDEPYRIALNQVNANLTDTINALENLKAQYLENEENLKLAVLNRDYAQREYYRASMLAKKRAGTEAHVDKAGNDLDQAKQQIAIFEQKKKQLIASLSGNPEIEIEKHPKYIQARAQVDQAELNLRRTVIKSPVNGIVSQISTFSIGDYVATGSSLFSVVDLDNIWVEANMKETDLTNVQPGQKAAIIVDTFPDLKLKGKVQGVGAATGAEFSILPPQNATGNWVKIVQRIPVRITIKQPDSTLPLRAGMSVVVKIDTRSLANNTVKKLANSK